MDYAVLKTEIALPAYNGMTDAQISVAVSAKTISTPKKAIVRTDDIINAIQAADFPSTQIPLLQMNLLIGGRETVDASPGTTIRAVFQSIFSGKAATISALSDLVNPYDNATTKWTQSVLGVPYVSALDISAARSLT